MAAQRKDMEWGMGDGGHDHGVSGVDSDVIDKYGQCGKPGRMGVACHSS